MRTWSLTLAAAAGVAALSIGALSAQGAPAPGKVDVTKVESGAYTADSSHSMVGWSVNHLGFNDYFGIFGDVAGTMTVDAANPANSKVDVTIPISSVVVASAGLKDHLLRAGKDGGKSGPKGGPKGSGPSGTPRRGSHVPKVPLVKA